MIDSILLEEVNFSLPKLLLAMALYHNKRKLIKQDQGTKKVPWDGGEGRAGNRI